MKIKLTYFKESGKYYSAGEYTTHLTTFHQIVKEVKTLIRDRKCPGLVNGHSAFITLIEPEECQPHLLNLLSIFLEEEP